MLNIANLITNSQERTPVMAFFGDSVTRGCFEQGNVYMGTIVDDEAVYHNRLKNMIAEKYDGAEVVIVNAGVGGDCAASALKRIQRDVLDEHLDFCCVCFGLNDVTLGERGRARYCKSLRQIFARLKENGIETVFMTPNMVTTSLSPELKGVFRGYAKRLAKFQTQGMMDTYMDEARRAALEYGVPVCDVYARWKEMEAQGVDITQQLANRINHPTREMHRLFAEELYRTIFSE
jgi:acyl-CoA thioesterase-1